MNEIPVEDRVNRLKNKTRIDILKRYRDRRIVSANGLIVQQSILKLNEDVFFEKIEDNTYIQFINMKFRLIMQRAQNFVFKEPNNIYDNFGSMKILYCFPGNESRVKIPRSHDDYYHYTEYIHTEAFLFTKNVDVKKILNEIKLSFNKSGVSVIFLGYILITRPRPRGRMLNRQTIYNLKAYSPSSNRKYHDLTCASTTTNRLCIYETVLHIDGMKSLKYMRHNTKNQTEIINMLKDEGTEIEQSVKNGNLITSLELLSISHDTSYVVCFYGFNIYLDENDEVQSDDDINKLPIIITDGKARTAELEEMKDYVNKYVLLYENGIHVAPYKFRFGEAKIREKKESNNFVLRKINIEGDKKKSNEILDYEDDYKNYDDSVDHVLGFDFETHKDEENKCIVFNGTFYGTLGDKQIKQSFYGKDCIDEIINFIHDISTPVDWRKSRPHEKIPTISLFGFNNSKFDNLFIYEKLIIKNASTKCIFAGSSIKSIRYNNISIYDISAQYKLGNLRSTCETFGLEQEKGVFPHKFVNKDNLYYNGDIPDIKYWNSKADYREYCKNYDSFDMKSYCEKYCLLDSKLVYELAKIHLNNCRGQINDRSFNVSRCITSASLSLKLFKQCFLEEDLYQSPNKIIEKERSAYKGGRTEVFKKKFISNKKTHKLLYIDINSAYPAGMCDLMPYKYQKTLLCEEHIPKVNEIIDYHLYKANSKYIGEIKNVIPNLLMRDEKGNIIACKNSDYAYHWGCEIKEAILNNFEIKICEVNEYEGKAIFKVFSEYFYNERLNVKTTNEALSQFYKNVLNSLYGKFGQKVYNKTAICKDIEEIFNLVKGDSSLIINYQVNNDFILVEYKDVATEYESIGKLVRFASFITATARIRLSQIMRDIGHEHIYYCDTDSVFTDKYPSESFINNEVLGKWKIESDDISSAVFIAPKCYHYKTSDKEVNKSKGIKDGLMIPQEYHDLVDGKVESVSKTSDMFFRSLEYVKIEPQERTISTVYDKRIWNNNSSIAFDNLEDWRENKI